MSEYASAYKVRYRSLRRLNQDHKTHITHGEALVPKSGKLPLLNTKSLLRIETPSGAYFDFPALIVRAMPSKGFVAALQPEAKQSQLALDELLNTEEFKRACEDEGDIDGVSVAVVRIDLALLSANSASGDTKITPKEDALPLSTDDVASSTNEQTTRSIKPPEPGETVVIYAVTFSTLLDYQTVLAQFSDEAILCVPYENETESPESSVELRITLPGKNTFNLMGRLHAVEAHEVQVRVNPDNPVYQRLITFPRTIRGHKRLASERQEHRAPTKVIRLQIDHEQAANDKMPLRRRLQRMSMDDKINLALSGDREMRMALASDGNKAIHPYLLKNARLSMDEIAIMARLPSLNPDVLVKIGENPAYTQNPQIVRNLVFNPRTPTKLAVRLIDRLPRNVLTLISKRTSMTHAIVQAAQKKLGLKV